MDMSVEVSEGAGFAWFRTHTAWWVVLVGGDAGAFLVEGTEEQAEIFRRKKAGSERAVAHKRCASAGDFPRPSECWNHPGFVRTTFLSNGLWFPQRYYCRCGGCDG